MRSNPVPSRAIPVLWGAGPCPVEFPRRPVPVPVASLIQCFQIIRSLDEVSRTIYFSFLVKQLTGMLSSTELSLYLLWKLNRQLLLMLRRNSINGNAYSELYSWTQDTNWWFSVILGKWLIFWPKWWRELATKLRHIDIYKDTDCVRKCKRTVSRTSEFL